MKKILLVILLMVNVIGCALLDAELYREAKKEMKEKGHTCERDNKGYWYCYDTK